MDNATTGSASGDLLLVDDDASALQIMQSLLGAEGYEIRGALNGQTALLFAKESPPDLILLDVRLPDMDGYQICRELRDDPKTAGIPVIFISGLGEVGAKIKGFTAGGVDFVTKPFQAEELLARVGTHLSLRRLQVKIEEQNARLEEEVRKTKEAHEEVKDAEEALRRANDRLEARVEERTRELMAANIQLVASERALEERLRFEELITGVSAKFVNLPAQEVDREVEATLKQVTDFFQIDYCGLLQAFPEKDSWQITHAASAAGLPPAPVNKDISVRIFPWSYQEVAEHHKYLTFSTLKDLPLEAETDKENYRKWGIRSSTLIPILLNGYHECVFSVSMMRSERNWTVPYIPRLRMLGEILVSALARSRIDEALRESEARLSLAASSGGIGLWSVSLGDRQTWATEKGWELLGLRPDSRVSRETFYSSIHAEDRESVREAMDRAIQSGKDAWVEYRIAAPPDGSVRWRAARSLPHFTSDGEVDRLMGALMDITERKRMEEELQSRLREIEDLKQRIEQENAYLREEIGLHQLHAEIVGQSEPMKKVLVMAEQVAKTNSTVLILGETGTGKELLARAIHKMSERKDRPLISVNCASLPPTLIESELFGREKGAYTGALTRMVGRFEVADGASIFLDEIGDLPLEVQAKLLRVLENGQFERLGSTKTLQVGVRIIAATNRDLAREVTEGRFRKDLFYRLNVFPITIPPVRERPEDIPLLAWAFVRQFEKGMGKRIDTISRKRMEDLQRYPWPGNVRELRNVIEHAMIVSSSKTLVVDLPQPGSAEPSRGRNLEDMERGHIVDILEKVGWRITGNGGAAEALGLKRTTLQSKMKKLGIRRPSSPSADQRL